MPKPGEGPSEATMNTGYVRALVGDARGRTKVEIRAQGDPGNRVTTRFFGQSALALRLDALPSKGGLLTPASAFGEVLIRRVRDAGIAIEG
jgi:short subunit dehydrogenase-like uncharacterized protein